MTALFRAEWLKLAGNRWAVTFLVWIFPMAALFMSIGAIVIALFAAAGSPDVLDDMAQFLTTWQGGFLSTWVFPNSEIGRFTIIAFTAIVFAGEYQHGTWKNLITRRPRWMILLNKFFTLGIFITIAFIMMSIFTGIGSILLGQVVGYDMGVFDGNVLGKFIRDISVQMGLTFVGTFISAGYTALAAMYARHVIGTIVIGLVVTLGEPSTLLLVSLARSLLHIDLYPIYLLTPSYNIANINGYELGFTYAPLAPDGFVPFTTTASWFILIAWVVCLIMLSIRNFTRQDITT